MVSKNVHKLEIFEENLGKLLFFTISFCWLREPRNLEPMLRMKGTRKQLLSHIYSTMSISHFLTLLIRFYIPLSHAYQRKPYSPSVSAMRYTYFFALAFPAFRSFRPLSTPPSPPGTTSNGCAVSQPCSSALVISR